MKQLMTALTGLIFALTLGFAAQAQSNYRIKSGDTITVEVLEDSQLNRSLLVLPGGTVDFPYAGTVTASGRTVGQVQQAIKAGIAPQFASEPTVFVSVSALRPVVRSSGGGAPAAPATIDIYFTGEVSAPGIKKVAPGTTFLQAMAQSGGFSNFAATKRVQLRRTDTSGQQTTSIINYRALARGARLANEIYLQDGDVILVPERRLFE
ncbi:polysaccharide export outer membrane protein [Litoreibacter meonggei]|uniref:Polysaccharide export outer membrane protein n=1 Tax=Litoreibacter meonggei TaxID=1049199 RepID=A0A497V656_9RHOB|nr:polysaccharide biosynthesis/export family protein [Litoreibacter meonggei]RLJ36188.1 polysaccharide export outer membrane protein [Litoreibacter meonggei]